MTAAMAQPVLLPALGPWLSPIRDIAPSRLQDNSHPFHPAVYGERPTEHVVVFGKAGFPARQAPAQPWIPGVSTPTGARLSTPTDWVTTPVRDAGEIALKVVEVALSIVLAGGVVAVPTGAYLIVQNLQLP